MARIKDKFVRQWIIENAEDIVPEYDPGILTIRGIHYRLVARGMTNTPQHYKRVVAAMGVARWDGIIPFETFFDHERSMEGKTKAEAMDVEDEILTAKKNIRIYMECYYRNKWENQIYYPEVFIEKNALLGVFGVVCKKQGVILGGCKGYPSLTYLYAARERFEDAVDRGQIPIILYFGDYDPSGEDIPRSIRDNLLRLGVDVEVRRIALLEEQVIEWNLPPAPTKEYKIDKRKDGSIGYVGDSRDKNWNGLGQVELDAVEPHKLQELCRDAIESVFDGSVHDDLMEIESEERERYVRELKDFVDNI
ncbi:MAG: hypothetical protein KAS04_04060 [Candidatus Aenigmarchaeota archaeon]|nr:hypothetical protein [Candidatus Aenigmarchaeota archaeon]